MATSLGERTAAVAWGGLLAWALMDMLERALGLIFVLNFSVDGLNSTVAWTLGLVSGLAVALGRSLAQDPRRHLALVAATAVAWAATLIPDALVALVAAVVGHIAATLLLMRLAASLGPGIALVVAVGWSVRIAVRAWSGTLPLHATDAGAWALLLGCIALVAGWTGTPARAVVPARGAATGSSAAWAALLAGMLWWGTPAVMGRWHGEPAIGWALAGVAAGTVMLVGGVVLPRWAAALAALAGAAWSLWAPMPGLGALLAMPGTLGMVACAARGEGRRWRLATVQAVGLVTVFLLVVSSNWSFVAGVGPLVHGHGAKLLFAALALVVPAAGWHAYRHVTPAKAGASPVAVPAALALLALMVPAVAGPAAPGAEADTLRVATWNVHLWHDGRLEGSYGMDEVRHRVEAIRPDILALQETDGARVTSGGMDGVAWLARETGMHAAQAPTSDQPSYGLALLARWPISSSRIVWLPTDGTHERPLLLATVDAPGGPVQVAVAHLEIPDHAHVRQMQVEAALGAIGPGAILLGDMNTPASLDDEAYRTLSAARRDAWAAGARGPGATYPAHDPHQRIDHIWIDDQWIVVAMDTFGTEWESDHLGVVADLRRA